MEGGGEEGRLGSGVRAEVGKAKRKGDTDTADESGKQKKAIDGGHKDSQGSPRRRTPAHRKGTEEEQERKTPTTTTTTKSTIVQSGRHWQHPSSASRAVEEMHNTGGGGREVVKEVSGHTGAIEEVGMAISSKQPERQQTKEKKKRSERAGQEQVSELRRGVWMLVRVCVCVEDTGELREHLACDEVQIARPIA